MVVVCGSEFISRRPWILTLIWHSFLIFIIFNATVVFKDGPARWIGLLVSLTLCLSWALISRQRSTVSTLFRCFLCLFVASLSL